jgi:hypothetical protein
MNERIRELAEQASQYANEQNELHGVGYVITFKEKFAELIVRECVTQCSKVLVEHTGQPSVTHNYAVGLCQDSITEHFGVEE